jgi:hypothetical protein
MASRKRTDRAAEADTDWLMDSSTDDNAQQQQNTNIPSNECEQNSLAE